jgi:tripartite-type tricarboxylate transporter receptor subunit TctC
MKTTRVFKQIFAALAAAAALTGAGAAQAAYPDKPVTVVVPWPPGLFGDHGNRGSAGLGRARRTVSGRGA